MSIKAAARQAHKGTRLLQQYLGTEVFPLTKYTEAVPPKREALIGLFYRAHLLLQGLCRLDHPSDFQLSLAANRALLEIIVDAILLHHERPSDAVDRLRQWERSARLRAAEATLAYVKGEGETLTALEKPLLDYVAKTKDDIERIRRDLWPNKQNHERGRHPNRWTDQNLLTDARRADRAHGTRLEYFYETEYRRMNLNVHGSGLAGVRGLAQETLEAWYAFAQWKSGEFMIGMSEILLQNLDCDREAQLGGLAGVSARWIETVGTSD